MKSRMRTTLHALKTAMQRRQHQSVPEQGRWLGVVLRSYYAYYAVPTNIRPLGRFRTQVARQWLRTLRRRGQRHKVNWARMSAVVNQWLPSPRIRHPWPVQRFDVRTQGKSPVR
jgi:hypothetical protein